LSIESNDRYSDNPFSAKTKVIAAVRVVFTVVNMTNGSNVYVRFGTIEFFFLPYKMILNYGLLLFKT